MSLYAGQDGQAITVAIINNAIGYTPENQANKTNNTASNSTTEYFSTKGTQDLIAALLTTTIKPPTGINCVANPNYPAGTKGDSYIVTVAGKIGGGSGLPVDIGDWIICQTTNAGGTQASVGSSWFSVEHNLAGALLAANNLSDLADVPTARTNLGLGTLATQDGTFSGTHSGTSSGTNTGDQTITLTGDVTGSGTGSFAATIANGAVTLAKQANVATSTVFYRKTSGNGAPEVQTLATLKTDLGLTGTNSGDQDLSGYVPITRTVNGYALNGNITLVKSDLSLGNVDNTSDANKPISTATQTALDLKVTGPSSATNNAAVRYDSTTGKLIKDSPVLIADTGAISGIRSLSFTGSTSGTLVIAVPAALGTTTLTLPAGTTDFSSTGGSGQYVKQTSAGGAFTVATIAASDLPSGIDAAKVANGTVSNAEFQYLDGVSSAIQTQLDGKFTNTVTAARLLGRYAGTNGAAQEITVGPGLVLSAGGELSASGGGGTLGGGTGSTDNALLRADGTGGSTVQASTVTLGDTGALAGLITISLNGSTSGAIVLQPAAIAGSNTLTLPATTDTLATLTDVSVKLTNSIATARLWGRTTAGTGAIEEIQVTTGLSFSGGVLSCTVTSGLGGSTGSTDNAILRADGTGGATAQNSGVTIGDTGAIAGALSLQFTGSSSGTATISPAAALGTSTWTLPGVTDQFVGRDTTDILTAKTLTAPKFANNGFIADANGNEQIVFVITASAVNQFKITNAATGGTVKFQAMGDDTDIPVLISPKGAGLFKISDGTDLTKLAAFDLSGATTGKTATLAIPVTNNRTITFFDATDTVAGKATTDIFTNKTYDTAGSGNSFLINGVAVTANTGTGAMVRTSAPTITSANLVTPDLGTPNSGTLTGCTGLPISTGVSGLGSGVATMLATFSSANIAAACTNETGSGALVFAVSPTLTTAELGSSTATTQAANDNSTKIATTAYVDAAVTGLGTKDPVAFAQTSALPANTYANGSSGVGATLTANANGYLILDGVTLTTSYNGLRVLIAGESTTANNGWYTVTTVGSLTTKYVLTRDVASDQAAEIESGYITPVVAPSGLTAGSNNAKAFISSAPSPFTVGTDSITFSLVGATYAAGNGLSLSGVTFSINTAITADLSTAQALTNKDLSSGTNTFPTLNQNTTGSAATLTTARTIGGVSFNGGANITVSTATGGFTVSGGNLAVGANDITCTGSLGSTGSRLTKGWFTDLQVTNAIAGSVTGSAATLTTPRAINSVNFDGSAAITVTAAAGTLTGTTLNSTVVTSSLTSVGTLTGLTEVVSDSATNGTSTGATFGHNSSGTAAAGYGSVYKFQLQDSTTADTDAGNLTWTWATATHASRKARAVLNVYDTATREVLRGEASGTAPMIGFLGASAVASQTGDAGTALVTFGLMTGTPTFGAANITGSTLASAVTASSLTSFGTSPTFVTPILGTPTSGTLTNCTFPTLNQNSTGSAASLSISGQTGLMTVTGLTSTNRIKTVRDAADTILELGGSYTPTGTWTSLTMVTPVLGTPTSGNLANCTALPISGLTASTATALGVGSVELGHASDTTLARVAAGVMSVEGQTINGYTTTATAAGTTTLTVTATRFQLFTGTTTQTVKLPTTSVIVGQDYVLTNTSTGLVSVQSSGANAICTLGLNQSAIFTAIAATPTTAAHWIYRIKNVNANTNGKRILVVTQSATPSMDTDNGDIVQITGIAQAITSMTTNLTGTPGAGDLLEIQWTDNGTARAITFGASFGASTVALPTTTVASTMLRGLFQYDTLWRCIAVV